MKNTLSLLQQWVESGWLRRLDAEFARFLSTEVPSAHRLIILAAALTSHQLGRGRVCLDLEATLNNPSLALSLPPETDFHSTRLDPAENTLPTPAEVLAHVSLEDWLLALKDSELVNEGQGNTPLVNSGGRLYLRRYWQYEQDVYRTITQRLATPLEQPVDTTQVRELLDILFKEQGSPDPDWQRLACALAVGRRFSVITGGPGTGKTTTVVTLLALLQALALNQSKNTDQPPRPLRIRLAAPTGKAAARLSASIANAVSSLPLKALGINAQRIKESIPVNVTTLHRLLGSLPDSRRFRHNATQRLALDVLVVDEASMVDLEMMAALLAALPYSARVILLGDKDQLASVEAGAVLGQICHRAASGHYTPEQANWLQLATGHTVPADLIDSKGALWDQAVVMLRHSHRFAEGSGIGQLAKAVNAGDTSAVAAIASCQHDDLEFISSSDNTAAVFSRLVIEGRAEQATSNTIKSLTYGYQHYLHVLQNAQPEPDADISVFDQWAVHTLEAHAKFQVLCALRAGPWGVEGLNQRIAQELHLSSLISSVTGWYAGRPVLITRNNYELGLMNGDIGITLEVPTAHGDGWMLRVAFPSTQATGGIKWVLPSRLQAVETVYALTVHKSQGSEFNHVVLVLPATPSPVLTRELLYTGITRARERFTLLATGPLSTLNTAIERQVLRPSGLVQNPKA